MTDELVSGKTIPVADTFNKQPFSYTVESVENKGKFVLYKLAYPSPVKSRVKSNNTIYAYYYRPVALTIGGPPRPGVVCLHILGGDQSLTKLVCTFFAEQGIPAIMCLLPYYGERRPPGKSKNMAAIDSEGNFIFVDTVKQGIADVRRTIDLFSSRPEINNRKVALYGISLGGIMGAVVAGVDDRLDKIVILLAGGNLGLIIGNSKETKLLSRTINKLPPDKKRQVLAELREIDPLKNARNLRRKAAEGRIMMINAAEDEVVPKESTLELAEAMGMSEKIVWLKGLGHYTAIANLPETLRKTVEFLADDTVPGTKGTRSVPGGHSIPPRLLFLRNVGALLRGDPPDGRCYLLDLDFKVKLKNGKSVSGKFQMVKGKGRRFSLKGEVPGIPPVSLGHGKYSWLQSSDGTVFRGSLHSGDQSNPVNHMDPKGVAYIKMIGGMCAIAAESSTAFLDQLVRITEKQTPDGRKILEFSTKKYKKCVVMKLKENTGIPESIEFNIKGNRGKINFRHWRMEAVSTPGIFAAPSETKTVEVEQKYLDRIFAAFFNQVIARLK